MDKCPLCGGSIVYLGITFLECRTAECENGPKLDVPEGFKIGWYYVNDPIEGVIKLPFLKEI